MSQSSPQALTLDGRDDALVLDSESTFDGTNGFAASFWIKTGDSFDPPRVPVLTKGNAWQVQRAGTSGRLAFITAHDGAARDTLGGLTLVDDGDWHHVAVAYDAIANEKTMYVDGVQEGEQTVEGALQTNDASVRVGTSPNRSDAFFAGQVDDLRFWGTARSQAEVQNTLWHELEGTEPDLLAYYPANAVQEQGGDRTLNDQGPSGISGRLQGGAGLADTSTPLNLRSINATDSLYEDRTELTWPNPDDFAPGSALLRVTRDGSLLEYRSTGDSTYTDDTGDSDVAYTYCLEVETDAGTYTYDCDEGARSFEPAANVSATDERYTSKIEITWADRSSVEGGYRLYRDGEQIADLAPNTQRYMDTDESALDPREDYRYCVAPYDANGEGETVCDVGRLGEVVPVTDFTATSGHYDDRVALDWTDAAGSTTGYTITRDGSEITTIRSPSVSTYEDTTATAGTRYTYCVIRQEGGIESTPICTQGSAGTITAPEEVTATDSTYDDRVELQWEDEAEVESTYLVYRQEGDRTGDPDTSAMTRIETLAPDAASYTDAEATPGRLYTYCVVAAAEEGARTPVAGTDPVGRTVDACDLGIRSVVLAPENVSATDSTAEDRVTITWSDPATRSALYRIYRRQVGTTEFEAIATPPKTTTEYVDRDVFPNMRHEYCVTALTGQGRESLRTCDFGSREVLKPSSVTAAIDEFENRVRVEWSDASAQEVGFRVYRRPVTEDGEPISDDSTRLHTTDRNAIVLLDTTGTPGQDYRYSVTALAAFDGDTLETSATTDRGRRTLQAPTEVQAADGESEMHVRVTWQDNSDAEEGHRIWRVSPAGDTTRAGETEPNVTVFRDSTATLEVDYTYLVAAFDDYGTSTSDDDEGFAKIRPPGSVSASDDYSDKVTVSWVDRSERESGYRVLKNGNVVKETDPNTTTYTDSLISQGRSATYCVKSMASSNSMSGRVCDDGTRTGGGTTSEARRVVLSNRIDGAGRNIDHKYGNDVSAALTGNGPTLLVGQPHYGLRFVGYFQGTQPSQLDPLGLGHVFGREDRSWNEVRTLQRGTVELGRDVDIGQNALLVASKYNVVRHAPSSDGWDGGEVISSDNNNPVVDLAADSDTTLTAIARYDDGGDDSIKLYDASTDSLGTVTTADFFRGRNLRTLENPGAIDVAGDKIAIGDVESNEIALYTQDQSGSWSEAVVLSASDAEAQRPGDTRLDENPENFAQSVALTEDNLFVGAPGAAGGDGRVIVYDVSENRLNRTQVLAPDENLGSAMFGAEVEVGGGGTLLVGMPQGNGHAYLYQERQTRYRKTFLFSSDQSGGQFGESLGIGGGRVFVGAPREGRIGTVYYFEVVAVPQKLAASDGTQNDRVNLEWEDQAENEDGYRIYRNGQRIATLGPDETTYRDYDADPGDVSRYCVSAYNSDLNYETQRICDRGWRLPDGTISGRVQQKNGDPFENADVCLSPNPNSSLLFDGQGGYATAADLAEDVPSTFTLEAWVRPEAKTQGSNDAAALAFNPANGDNRNLILYNHDNGKFRFVDPNGNYRSSSEFATNSWHHVAVTVDSAAGRGRLYVNGNLERSFTTDVLPQSGDFFSIGQERDGGGTLSDFWKGQIDEVRLWETARTQRQIDSLRAEPLTGEEDSLLAYWPLDERGGIAAANVAGEDGSYYADYRGGVHPSEQGAPLNACVETGADGNYSISELRYGDGTEFTVIPREEPHTFQPGRTTVAISPNTPVQNQVQFTDQTRIPVSGKIQYEGTQCPVQNVEIDVDDETKGTTDSGGAYSVGVLPGEHTIAPVLEGEQVATSHSFEPERRQVEVNEEKTGVDFSDTTTNTLTLDAHGGCGFSVGIAEVKIRSTNGCYERTMETDSTGLLEADLPPQEYTVQVTGVRDVPDPKQKGAIERYFRQQGTYTVDLAQSADTTVELIYRAPITARVKKWPEPASCGNVDVPVLERNEELDLTLEVVEDYGNGNFCPADSAQVTVYDELPDKGDEPLTYTTDSTGQVEYHTFARSPNLIEGRVVDGVDRSYQKSLTMVAEAGVRRDETTEWAIAEGLRPRKGTRFVTDPVDFPITVLRDPPGDQSYSYLESGAEFCRSLFTESSVQSTTSIQATLGAHLESEAGWWASYVTITEVIGTVSVSASTTIGANSRASTSMCMNTNERISTGDDGTAVGRSADLFMGAGVNFVFSTSDVLQVEGEGDSTCDIERSQTTSFRPDSIATTYNYTRGHVKGTMIPTLRELQRTSDEERLDYEASIRQWEHILYQSDSLASEAEPVTSDDHENISLNENVSFSGGADYEYQESSSYRTSLSASAFLSTTIGASVYGGALKPVVATFRFSTQFTARSESGAGVEEGTNSTWGFVLSDGDGGDNYTVDVKKDPLYGTPVFDVRSGLSSCPYEPWRVPYDDFSSFSEDRQDWKDYQGELRTTRRDKVGLSVNGAPVKEGVPPDEKATFGATLINDSPSDETRRYELRMLNESNPKGAIVNVNGTSVSSSKSFTVEPGTASNLTMTVERGTRAFRYDSLGVVAYAPCGFFAGAPAPTTDTMYVSVEFEPPSSPITLNTPEDGLALNRVTKDDSLDVLLEDFSMDTTDTGHRVSEIGVFVRPVTNLSNGLNSVERGTPALPDSVAADSTVADTSGRGRFFKGKAARTLFGRLRDSAEPKVSRGVDALQDWSKILVRVRRRAILEEYDCTDLNCDLEDISAYFKRALFRQHDGEYEMAAYTKTTNPDGTVTGAYVGDPIRVSVDTKRPRVHGTPEPADGLLTPGDDVALTLDEQIDCGTLRPNENVTLAYADSADAAIPITTTCDGRVLYLQPTAEAALDSAETETLVATVHSDTTDEGGVQRDRNGPVSLTDDAGNPLPSDVEWRFSVQRSAVVWKPSTDTLELQPGDTAQLEATLVNYRQEPLRYALEGLTNGLSIEGEARDPEPLPPGGSRTLQMTVEVTREPGTYTDTVRAVGTGGEPTSFILRRIIEREAVPSAANVTASATPNQAVELRWISPDSSADRYEVYRGGTPTLDTTATRLASVSSKRSRFVDTTAALGQTHYYRLRARTEDGGRSDLSDASEAFLYPSQVDVQAKRTFAGGQAKQDFRLVALPGRVDRPLSEAVPGTPGEDWTAYRDNGSAKSPFVSAQKADEFALRAGRGYWLRHSASWTVEERVPTVALRGDTTAVIDVHDGWNIISNPLGKDVRWRAVDAANEGPQQALWRFSGRYERMRTFPSAKTGEAFYFLNDQGLDSLAVPYPGAPFERADSSRAKLKKAATESTDSTLTLATYRKGIYTSQTRVGLDSEARKEWDDGDQVAPPARFEGARIRSVPPTASSAPRQQLLAHEMRPTGTRGQWVDLRLEAEPGAQVRVEARRAKALGTAAVRLVNRNTGQSYDLLQRQSVEVDVSDRHTSFVLLFGTTAYVKEAWSDIVPPEATLRPNYPNPFRQQTTIEYAVPEDASVRLEVYDVLGRRVATLVDARKEAGWHRERWGARGSQGRPVASGVYFGRLRVDDEVYTHKMVVVR